MPGYGKLREQQSRTGDAGAWHATLRGYAGLQLSLAEHAGDLLGLGLADLRPGSVPGQFERLLADPATEQAIGAPGGITREQYQALRLLAPRLRGWCAELAGLGIPASLDHADVTLATSSPPPACRSTGETRRSPIPSPASSSRCAPRPSTRACPRGPPS